MSRGAREWSGVFALLGVVAVAGCGDDGGGEAPPTQRAAAAARATELEQFIRDDFAAIDGDGSGAVEPAEARKAILADFRRMDLNRDGVVTIDDVQAELDANGGGKATGSVSDHLPHDANGDGEITEREYVADVFESIHEPMDVDSDGEVTADEAVAYQGR